MMNRLSQQIDYPSLAPELELLLLCARRSLNDSQQIRLRQLVSTPQLDWPLLLRMAAFHGLSFLLFRNLQVLTSDYIPKQLLGNLHQAAVKVSARNLLFINTLSQIITLLTNNNIQTIVFKGPVLSQTAYGNINLRHFSDLDILVAQKDAIKARDLLIANHYSCKTQLLDNTEESFLNKENVFSIINTTNNISIDLHWELTGRYSLVPLYLERIIERATTTIIVGQQFPTLSVEDNIVFLCIHASKHCWPSFESISCISALARNTEKVDWSKVFTFSKQLRSYRMVLLGLLLGHILFDLELPSQVISALYHEKRLIKLGEKIVLRLTLDHAMQVQNDYICQFSTFHICIRDSFLDGIKHLFRFLHKIFFQPTANDRQSLPLPPSLYFLYYFYRPLRLAWEYIKEITKQR